MPQSHHLDDSVAFFVYLTKQFFKPLHSFYGFLVVTKGSQTEVVLTILTEACARGSYYLDVLKQVVEAFPGLHTLRTLEPDVGRVNAAEEADAKFCHGISNDFGISLIIVNIFLAFLDAFLGEDNFGTFLHYIGGAVEFGALTAVPHSVQGHFLTIGSFEGQFLRNNGVTTTGSGKSCGFGQRTEFNGTFLCSLDSEDASRKLPGQR